MKIKHFIAFIGAFSTSVVFAAEGMTKENAAAINSACAADAKTANCGDKQVGSGLLKCLHEHKKDHKDFKLSPNCKEQIEKARPAKQQKSEIDNACANDAKTANCGDKQVGSGLLKCLHEYKKDHKDFKLSPDCKTAIDKRREEQKQHDSKKDK